MPAHTESRGARESSAPHPDVLEPGLPPVTVHLGGLGNTLRFVTSERPDSGITVAVPVIGTSGDGTDVVPAGLDQTAADHLAELDLDLSDVLEWYQPPSAAGSVTIVPLRSRYDVKRLALVGVGAGTVSEVRSAGAELARATRDAGAVVSLVAAGDREAATAFVEGVLLASHRPLRWGSTPGSGAMGALHLLGHDPAAVEKARVGAEAAAIARNLGVTPSNIKNPAWLADQAVRLAERREVTTRVWSDADLADEGFGGLLAVGGASATPPRLVQLSYTPEGGGASAPHVVLVGKGITFDTGGLNIKPGDSMALMKSDMVGAAAVLAVVGACRAAGVTARVTGLLPLAENAIGASAYRPSDVVTQYGGTTVEIGNTDAEGRIVLADALAYADAHLDPDLIIDIATLTGAATVSLGRGMAPVFGTDVDIVTGLVAAGERTGELLWPFPFVNDYRSSLDSEVADLSHIGDGVGGGAIIAAMFLREFVGQRRWAHLDIAGPGRSERDSGLTATGPTGFGVRLLLDYLQTL